MTRKELYQNHKSCMIANAVLLVADLCCVLLSARCLSSFIALFSDFSYEKGLEILGWLGMVFTVQLLCAYVKRRCFVPARDAGTNRLECALYARYLESPVRPDSQARLSVICEKDIPECMGFFTEKLPAAIQAIAGVIACTLMLAEPFENLDEEGQRFVRQLLGCPAKARILVSHTQRAAEENMG